MQSTIKQKKLYDYLQTATKFTKIELSDATGYKISTITTYINKKLINHMIDIIDEKNGVYQVKSNNNISIEEFVDYMSQTSKKCRKNL